MTDRLAVVLLTVLLVGCGPAHTEPPADAVIAMLDASAEAWNRGDLDRFLDDYLEDATFVGSSGLIVGVAELERRYRANYWTGDEPVDRLRFEEVRVTALGAAHALAVGRFILEAPSTGELTSTGFFSLVLASTPDGWRILHDHSSSVE